MHIWELIAQRREEILASWEEQARRSPGAEGLTREELFDSLPDYLDHLTALLRGDRSNAALVQALVEDHVATRLRQGYDLDDVIQEYTLLGETVAAAWSEGKVALPAQEIQAFFQELHLGITTAIENYSTHLLHEVQSEKREVMALERLAAGPAREHAPGSLARLLNDALNLVSRACAADGAVLLLNEPEPRRLRLAAVVGPLTVPVPPDELDPDETPLVARLASTPAPVTLAKLEQLEPLLGPLPDKMQSLVGSRLWARGSLVGLLFIYARSSSAFHSRERRRLVALANRLANLVDHDRTRSTLEALVQQLRREQTLREQFVAILAHDLRGPLAAAGTAAALLARYPPGDPATRALPARIVSSLERADRMVRDLLDASRIRAGEPLPLKLEPTDLGQLAREVLSDLAAIHGERFDLQADQPVCGVWSPSELRRALWNLAVNAVKYGAPGGRVTVSIRREDGVAALAVHNAGPGLSPEEQERLFEPFRRSSTAQRSGQVGWGLGLTLVRGCAQAHGGTVSVESAPGQGTTFTLRLPLEARAEVGAEPAAPSAPA